MNTIGVLVTASMLALLGMGVVTPIVMVRRAIRAHDPSDRPFLLASAVGTVLWVLALMVMYAHAVVPDSRVPSWIADPLENYAAATTWLYRNRNLYIGLTSGSILLFSMGAVATPTRRQRASRRLPE